MKRGAEMKDTIRDFLITYMQRYPKAQLIDLYKALFQTAFGCAHAVTDVESARDWIVREFSEMPETKLPLLEALPGEHYRVSLDWLKEGLSAETLARLFQRSARPTPCATAVLRKCLAILLELAEEGTLPFSEEQTQKSVHEWCSFGFPSCHHSQPFRDAYSPAYRLIHKDYIPLLPLLCRIDKALAEKAQPIFLAIDGGSAAGKSTLALFLQRFYSCTVFHMDDYFLQPNQRTNERLAEPGGNVDRERFLQEVLLPLHQGKEATVRAYDCQLGQLMPPTQILPGRLNIIEGAYSMHPLLQSNYDLSVFLEIAPELQHLRILRREKMPMQQQFFDQWIPMENAYFSAFRIPAQCTLRIPAQNDE